MQGNRFNSGRKTIHRAVLAALPVLVALYANHTYAACTGTIASGVSAAITTQCTGAGAVGNLSNSSASDYLDNTSTATAGNNTLLQFDGQGRTLNNAGIISNNRVITGTTGARGRTAVLMGAATLNAGTGTLFVTTAGPTLTLPAAGATTVILNAAPTAAYVGQTLVFGRYNAAEGDFLSAQTRIITAVDIANKTVTFADALPADYAGTANTDPVGYKVVSNFGGGDDIVNNSGTISSQILAAEINGNKTAASPNITSVSYTAAVKAVTASVEGNYFINNSTTGIISVKHDGIGNALAIEEGGAVTEMTVNNSGLISAERTASLSLVAADNTGLIAPTATSTSFAGFRKQNIGNVNAINTQEEAEVFTLNNAASGIVRASGDYAGTIYMRAAEKHINNDGLIEYVGTKGYAIAAVSDSGGVRSLELNNNATGEIKGDILVTNGNALRYYTLSTAGGAAGLDARLNINNQFGQSDSDISNAGKITGNFYYANGTHTLENKETGVIVGNIDVDQRATYSAAGNGTLVGTKTFSFTNEGSYTGNITVRTDTGSQVTLSPTITGAGLAGAAAAAAAPQTGIAGMGGTLKVWDGTTSTMDTVTLTPIVANGVVVKNGDFYKVADSLFGTTMPTVEDSLLIDWTADNTGGALLIGASVKNAANIAGLNSTQAGAINALLTSQDPLAIQVQAYTDAADLAKAGEQLHPETNNGAFHAARSASNQVLGLVGDHLLNVQLAVNGNSGVATGEFNHAPSVWLQGFGVAGDQDARKNMSGYDINAYGFVLGADALVSDRADLRVGGALSYAQSNVENTDTTRNRSDIDSVQATIYGNWQLPSYYLNGALSLAKHNFDSKRNVLGSAVTGKHDAWQYTAKIDAGWPIQIKSSTLIPVASITYSHLDEDAYTESGAGALAIAANNSDSIRSGLGMRALIPLSTASLKSNLELRTQWLHEFADTAQDTTARFAAGGSSFSTPGIAIKRDSANLGASLRFAGGSQVKQTLELSYDAELRSSYVSHTGKLTARFDF